MSTSSLVLSWLVVFAVACGDEPPFAPDGGTSPDDGGLDAGLRPDDGGLDGGGLDGGDLDGGGEDAGIPSACVPWRGVRLLGGALDDEASDVLVDPEGAVLVAGYVDARNDRAPRALPGGDARGVVFGIARDGSEAIVAELDTPGPDAIDRIAHDLEGQVLAIGRSQRVVGGHAPVGGFDVFGGRLVDGSLAPSFHLGVAADERVAAMSLDEGGLHLVGHADPEIDGGAVVGWEDGFVAHLADDAVLRVDSESAEPDMLFALATRGDLRAVGGVAQGGPSQGAFVRRLDASLRPLWSTRLSPVPYDAVTGLAVDEAGELVAISASSRAEGGQQVVVHRLSAETGEPIELGSHGGPDADYPTAFVRAPDGGLVVVGETLGGIRRPIRGAYDVFVMWIGADGALRHVEELGGPGDDRPAAVALDACGNVVVAGYATATLEGVEGPGRREAFVAVYDAR